MKKFALLALTLAFASSAAGAQEKTKAEAKPKAVAKSDAKPKWTEHLAEHFAGLKLTAEQKDKIAAANKKHHDAMDHIKATVKDAAEAKAQIKGHQDAEHAEFHEILTAEQYAVFEKNMAKMEEHEKMEGKMKKDGKMDKMDHGKMEKMDHDKMEKMEHGKMEKPAAKPVKKP